MEISTKFNIGDAVYSVSEYKFNKDIIQEIRISKGKVEYGFARKSFTVSFLYGSDSTLFFDEKDVFLEEEKAKSHFEKLKKKSQERKQREDEKNRTKRIKELRREIEDQEEKLKNLEEGKCVEPDYYEED